MTDHYKKRKEQLGMALGTANARLRKELLFNMATRLNENNCFRCGGLIEDVNEFSIDHKTPWLDSKYALTLYFEPSNIAFSHLVCNIAAARKPHKKYFSIEERKEADRLISLKHNRKKYTSEKRRERYLKYNY